MPGGTSTFYDSANKVASGPINPDGTYAVSRVHTGPAKIAIMGTLSIAMTGPSVPGASARGRTTRRSSPWV